MFQLQVAYDGDPVCAIVNEIYADLNVKKGDITYLRNRAILTPLNENVEVINQEVLKRLTGELGATQVMIPSAKDPRQAMQQRPCIPQNTLIL